jgi:hypothetical protein
VEEAPVNVSPLQWLFANNWPIRIWLIAFSLGTPLAALSTIDFSAAHAFGWRLWLALLAMSLLFAMAGFLFGAIAASAVLPPLYWLRTHLNGGPFALGDMVVVLSRTHRGRRARVYDTWQGDTVRVEIGEEAKAGFRDIFGQHELLRQ